MTGPDDSGRPDSDDELQLPPELSPRGQAPRKPPASDQAKAPMSAKARRKRILKWAGAGVAVVVLLTSVTSFAFLQHLLNSITHTNVFGGLTDRPGGGVKGDLNILHALGGVTVCTPTPIHDPVHRLPTGGYGGSGLELPAGKSELDGTRALEYVRAREFDPSADLGRIQRQQKFMSAMVQKAKSAGLLLDLPRLYSLLGAVGHSLTTDSDFGLAQIKDLASNLHSMSPAHVEFLTVPLL